MGPHRSIKGPETATLNASTDWSISVVSSHFGIAMAANFDQFSGFGSDLGRVVITHSTYLEGLIPWLKALSKEASIQTITPAVISRVRGRSNRLQLRVSVPIRGGFKLMARKGTSAQEVFVVTTMDRDGLQKLVNLHRP